MLRRCELSDLDAIVELEKDLFKKGAWSKDNFLYELNENPYSNLWVIELDCQIIGYGGLWILFEQAQVTTLGIHDSYQGKGYARKLMDCMVSEAEKHACDSISLEVRVSNERALDLYRKYGFEISTIRENYYQDPLEDAYLMIKSLGGII